MVIGFQNPCFDCQFRLKEQDVHNGYRENLMTRVVSEDDATKNP